MLSVERSTYSISGVMIDMALSEHVATINTDGLGGHILRLVACQKDSNARDLEGASHIAERHGNSDLLLFLPERLVLKLCKKVEIE